MYLLHQVGGGHAQLMLWRLVETDTLGLHTPSGTELQRMPELMAKYHDVPMDLADASLLALAETLGTRDIFTFDSDFQIYRFADGHPVNIVPPVGA
jgi:uncharacterized protein